MSDVCHGAPPHQVPLGVGHRDHGPHHGGPVVVLEARHRGDWAGVNPGTGHALAGGQSDAAGVIVILAERQVRGLDVNQLGLVRRQHLRPSASNNSSAVVLSMMCLVLINVAAATGDAFLRSVRKV